jgi:glucokinase
MVGKKLDDSRYKAADMTYLLAGDLGGTKTLLRLVAATSPEVSIFERSYHSQAYPSLVSIVREFVEAARSQIGTEIGIESACLGIAGAVIDRTSYLPNLDWHIDADSLEGHLNIPQIKLIRSTDLHALQPGQPRSYAPIAIIGAGTGLGQGFLIYNGTEYQVIPTEGGHTDFAARSIEEFELVRYICQQKQIERVSNERVISGMGIIAIYQYLRDTGNISENPELATVVKLWESQIEKSVDPASVISAMAIAKTDSLSQATMTMFVSAYGAEAGNLALKTLPYGGLYIAGGIAAKNLPLLIEGTFITAFNHKGRVSDLLTDIPVYVILNPQVGLIGAVAQAAKLGMKDEAQKQA